MNNINNVLIILSILSILISLSIVLYNNYKTRETMEKLDDMLNKAINDEYIETTYDESVISALESKLNRYLTSSSIASKNLTSEKDKVKSLISDISHQTKTPISNILLYSELLSENMDLPQDTSRYINQISKQAEKLSFLISTLIKSSRLESDLICLSKNKNSISKLLDLSIEQIKLKAKNKNISISLDNKGGHRDTCKNRPHL